MMARVTPWRSLPALVVALLMAPAAAQAAPVAIGTGGTPRVVAAPDGTLHGAWVVTKPDSHSYAHYCRIPPGATACAANAEWDFGLYGSIEVELVREPSTGKVDVLAVDDRDNTRGTYLIQSNQADAADGTFAAMKKIAPYELSFYAGGGAAFGPGNFQVSYLSNTNGVDLKFATTNNVPPATSVVTLDDLVPAGYYQAMGLVDSTTVMVVGRQFDSEGGLFSWRVSPSDGSERDISKWSATKSMAGVGAEESFTANGIAAPVLVSEEQVLGNDHRLALRRYDKASNAFGAPVTVTEHDYIDDHTAHEDLASNVHVVFAQQDGSNSHNLQYLASSTGDSWPANPITLSNETPSGHMVVAAGPDGHGAVFWRRAGGPTGSTDDDTIVMARVDGPGSAFPAPAPPPGAPPQPPEPPPGCIKTPSLGIAKFLATGCFTASGSKLTTTAAFRVNGLLMDPKGKTVTLDTTTRTLTTPAGVAATLGPLQFGDAARKWTFPASGSFTPPLLDFDKPNLGGELLKLALAGDAKLKFVDSKLQIATHMQLPAPFSTVNGDVTLSADNFGGLQLGGLHVKVGTLPYGFKNLDLEYVSDPPVWAGSLEFEPPVGGGDKYAAQMRIAGGKLDFVHVAGMFAAPGKQLYPPYLYLRQLGLTFKGGPPVVLQGETILAGGPSAGDTSIVGIGHPFDDFGTLTLTLSAPFKLDAFAPVYVLGYKLGQGELHYTYPGDIAFSAHAALGDCSGVGAEADISGMIKTSSKSPEFNAAGSGKVCLGPAHASASAVVSSKGIAACGEIGISEVLSVSAGAGHYWNESGVHLMFKGCDTGPYAVASSAAVAGTRQAGGARTFNVAAGVKQLDVQLTGDTAPPLVTLSGPNGATYATQAAGVLKSDTHVAVAETDVRHQTLLIPRPAAGTWTVTPQPGSAAITGLALARDVPAPRLSGRVRRRGSRRELRWTARAIPGQTLSFYEEGEGVLRRIGASAGTRGTIRFSPIPGRGGRRRVTAIVSQGGLPRTKVKLATYVLPRPPKPGAARRLKATHRGTRLVLSWKPGARAASQELRVALGDGTRRLYDLKKRKRTFTLKGIRKTTTGTVFVTAIRADGIRGRTVRAKVRARR